MIVVKLIVRIYLDLVFASVAELVDALDLGFSFFKVRVRLSSEVFYCKCTRK